MSIYKPSARTCTPHVLRHKLYGGGLTRSIVNIIHSVLYRLASRQPYAIVHVHVGQLSAAIPVHIQVRDLFHDDPKLIIEHRFAIAHELTKSMVDF